MRAAIISLLRQHAGKYFSGEEMSRQLGVSRTAVWKHIQQLKLDGYIIESSSRLGHRLVQESDQLLPASICSRLNTKKLGSEIHYFSETGSTNNEAKIKAIKNCPEGTLVIAEAQSGGRGRLSRGWFAPFAKGIYFSLVLRPPFRPHDAPKCTLMAAVAVNRALRTMTGISCGIKWPNDILCQGRKLVGILTEMSAEMDAINYVVLGIGINVNMAEADFPAELKPIATSVSIEAGRPISRLDLFLEVLNHIESTYMEVLHSGFGPVLQEWRQNSVTLGQTVDVLEPDRMFTGRAIDIDTEGALLVQTAQGVERVIAGDVSIRARKI